MTIRDLPPTVRAFASAVGWGAFAGAAPYFVLTVPMGLVVLFGDNLGPNRLVGLYFMVLPLLISLPIVMVASMVLGLPLTAFLSRLGKETGQTYVVCGFLFGAIPFIVLILSIGEFGAGIFAFSGGLGGAVTGWVWGRHRDHLANERLPD